VVAEYQAAAALKRELLYRLAVEALMEQKCGSHMVFAHDVSAGKMFFKKSLDNFAPVVHIHTIMAKQLDMSAAENCVCFNLRWVTRAVTQFYDAEMRRHGIRPTQGSILESLKTKNSWHMAELSDWLGMERTTLVRNLRPLQRDGLVRVSGGGRGRLVELAITAKGRKQMEKLAPAWKSAQRAAVKTLGEKRWSAILSDLETAALALNK
jgi:DNA-binding MarR family transcriptional regulator